MTNTEIDSWDPLTSPSWAQVRRSLDTRTLERLQESTGNFASGGTDIFDDEFQHDINVSKTDTEQDKWDAHVDEEDHTCPLAASISDMSNSNEEASFQDSIDFERVQMKKEKYRQLMVVKKAASSASTNLKATLSGATSKDKSKELRQNNAATEGDVESEEKQRDKRASPSTTADKNDKDLRAAKSIQLFRQAQLKRSQSSRGCYEDIRNKRDLGPVKAIEPKSRQAQLKRSQSSRACYEDKETGFEPVKAAEPKDKQELLKRSQSLRACFKEAKAGVRHGNLLPEGDTGPLENLCAVEPSSSMTKDEDEKERDFKQVKAFEPKGRERQLKRSQSLRVKRTQSLRACFNQAKKELRQDNLSTGEDTASLEMQCEVESSPSMTHGQAGKEIDLGSFELESRQGQLKRSNSSRDCYKEVEGSKSKALVSSLAALVSDDESGKTVPDDAGKRAFLRRAVSDLNQKIRADLVDTSSPGNEASLSPKISSLNGSPSKAGGVNKPRGMGPSPVALRIPRRNTAKIQLPNPGVASRLAGTKLSALAAAAGVKLQTDPENGSSGSDSKKAPQSCPLSSARPSHQAGAKARRRLPKRAQSLGSCKLSKAMGDDAKEIVSYFGNSSRAMPVKAIPRRCHTTGSSKIESALGKQSQELVAPPVRKSRAPPRCLLPPIPNSPSISKLEADIEQTSFPY